MQVVGQFCILLIIFSVIDFQKRVLGHFLEFFLLMDCVSWFKFMSQTCDFGCGFLMFGCFKQLFNLISLFLFINLGLKFLQFGFHFKGFIKFLYEFGGKSGNLKKNEPSLLEMVRKSKQKSKKSERELKKSKVVSNGVFGDEFDDLDDGELRNVDEVFDVLSLRKMVKREKRRADAAYTELDKERVAAATAADEAMAMILRVQKEKSLIEMEANQYRRLVEEKQIHDQEVIQSLRWMVLKHESERGCVEDQLRFYERRFKILPKGDDRDICEENDERSSYFNSSNGESSPWHGLISSLDFDLSTP